MSDLFLLSEAQMRRIEPYFPLSHGIARVDDRMAISGIVFVIKNGLRWRDAPREYGPHKTIYNRLETTSFLHYFSDLRDYREPGKVEHPLPKVLLLILLAVLAGAETFTDIARFG